MTISNTTIQIKKSGTTGNKPTSLNYGELALNYYDGKLFYKDAAGNISYFYGANNGPSFATANANNNLILASTPNDTLSLNAANGISITACTTSKTITISDATTFTLATGAYNGANSAGSYANSAYAAQNTTGIYANSAYAAQNTTGTYANAAFLQANSAYAAANAAGGSASAAAFTQANSAFLAANNANANAITSGAYANAAFSAANAAFSKANTSSNSITYTRNSFTANVGQTLFTTSYTVDYLQVYVNGVLLSTSDYTATNGSSFTLNVAANMGDIVEAAAFSSGSYTRNSFTATGGQTLFTSTYVVGQLQVYVNGVLLSTSDYTATNGSSFTLSVAANAGDLVEAINVNLTSNSTFASITTGNLTFTGTGNRITGDFSNATAASRVAIQTSTTNGNTNLEVIPNGTATRTDLVLNNAADPTNASLAQMFISNAEMRLISNIRGTGTYLPMTFYTGGSERMRLDTSGNLLVGITSGSYKFMVGDGTRDMCINPSSFLDGIFIGTIQAKPLVLGTTNSERMRIDSAGNVGIGTSSPGYKLDVNGGIRMPNATVFWINNAAGTAQETLQLYSDNNTYLSTPGALILRTNGTTERMRIDSSGNVGIGTSSPSYKLDVVGTGDLANRVSTTGTSNAASIILQSGSGTTSGLFAYARFLNNDTNAQDWRIGTYGTNNLSIVNAKAGTVPVTVDTSGNVGIGTSSPARKLDVRSSAGTVFANVGNSGNDNNGAGITFTGSSTTKNWFIGNQFNVTGAFEFTQTTANGGTSPAATPSMVIDSSGNVGIGTSSPTRKLVVSNAGAQGFEFGAGVGAGSGNELLNYNRSTSLYVQKTEYASSYTFVVGTAGNVTAATIDSSGNLLVGTNTSAANDGGVSIYNNGGTSGRIDISNKSGAAQYACAFYYSTTPTLVGTITTSSSGTTYNTISDYRLKNVIGAVTGQGARIDALKPIDYQWKDGNVPARGFLAHEFQEVYASSVTGEKDAVDADGNPVYQQVQASTVEVIADLVAEIQSLRARVAALESR